MSYQFLFLIFILQSTYNSVPIRANSKGSFSYQETQTQSRDSSCLGLKTISYEPLIPNFSVPVCFLFKILEGRIMELPVISNLAQRGYMKETVNHIYKLKQLYLSAGTALGHESVCHNKHCQLLRCQGTLLFLFLTFFLSKSCLATSQCLLLPGFRSQECL